MGLSCICRKCHEKYYCEWRIKIWVLFSLSRSLARTTFSLLLLCLVCLPFLPLPISANRLYEGLWLPSRRACLPDHTAIGYSCCTVCGGWSVCVLLALHWVLLRCDRCFCPSVQTDCTGASDCPHAVHVCLISLQLELPFVCELRGITAWSQWLQAQNFWQKMPRESNMSIQFLHCHSTITKGMQTHPWEHVLQLVRCFVL